MASNGLALRGQCRRDSCNEECACGAVNLYDVSRKLARSALLMSTQGISYLHIA